MKLAVIESRTSTVVDEFVEQMEELNLIHSASEAATEMGFDSIDELHESIKRAMDLCLSSGISIKGNFKRIYKSFDNELTYDWKLSLLAYKLVCLNGKPSNPNVAKLNIQLIKNEHLNHF
jgi:uncharacterized protein YqgV (UPF0045/DUF77 family)